MKIVIIRLMTGAEIIGEEITNEGAVTLKNPVFIKVDPTKSTKESFAISIQKFSVLSDQKIYVFPYTLLMTEPYRPAPEIEEQYKAAFNDSKIIQVGGLITG